MPCRRAGWLAEVKSVDPPTTALFGLDQSGDLVEHQRSGDGDVEAVAAAYHRNLDRQVQQLHRIWRDSAALIAEHDDGALARDRLARVPPSAETAAVLSPSGAFR